MHSILEQIDIFSAGSTDDWKAVTAGTNEPLVTTMSPDVPKDAVQKTFLECINMSAYQLWQLHKRKRELRKESLDHWNATIKLTGTGRPVDAVIGPNAPFTATPHGVNRYVYYHSFLTSPC